ncbi:hypothetical protein [Sphingopyxis fribergensis]
MQNRTPIAAEARPPLPDFTPVPRKYRHDGWAPERQKAFVAALADAVSASRAAGTESFRRVWEAALDFGVAAVKKRPSWRQARKAKAADG